MITVEIPMAVPSLANMRGHTRAKGRLVRQQRNTVMLALRAKLCGGHKPSWSAQPLTVRLVRVAPRALDSDNYISALKPTRDAVTEWLGYTDDSHENLRWLYAPQEKGRPKYQAVRIEIVEGHHDCEACGSWLLEAG